MEDILKEMAETAKKGEQNQYSGTYSNYSNDLLGQPQTQQPMTPEQAQQYTTDKLLRALSEASKRPQGETDYQRRQRLNNLTNQMRNEDAAISQRNNEYYYERNQRLLSGSGINSPAPRVSNGDSDYEQKRAARLRAASGGTSSTPNPNAKPAGFGAGYAGGYTQPEPVLETATGITTNSARRGRRTGLEAGPVIIVKDDPPPTPPAEPTKYCKCKGSDQTDLTGIMCINFKTNEQYQSGYYPLTSQCFSDVTSYQGPTLD